MDPINSYTREMTFDWYSISQRKPIKCLFDDVPAIVEAADDVAHEIFNSCPVRVYSADGTFKVEPEVLEEDWCLMGTGPIGVGGNPMFEGSEDSIVSVEFPL